MGREPISSGHFSHDLQVADVVGTLTGEDATRFAQVFPQWDLAEWSGSWLDTAAMGVDEEWPHWVTDWIEEHTAIVWVDGEPWLEHGWKHDPQRDGAGCGWCGAWAQVDNEGLCEECYVDQ